MKMEPARDIKFNELQPKGVKERKIRLKREKT